MHDSQQVIINWLKLYKCYKFSFRFADKKEQFYPKVIAKNWPLSQSQNFWLLHAPFKPPQSTSDLHGANCKHAPQSHVPTAIPIHFPAKKRKEKFCEIFFRKSMKILRTEGFSVILLMKCFKMPIVILLCNKLLESYFSWFYAWILF